MRTMGARAEYLQCCQCWRGRKNSLEHVMMVSKRDLYFPELHQGHAISLMTAGFRVLDYMVAEKGLVLSLCFHELLNL